MSKKSKKIKWSRKIPIPFCFHCEFKGKEPILVLDHFKACSQEHLDAQFTKLGVPKVMQNVNATTRS